DPSAALLRAAPQSAVERHLLDVQQHRRAGRLIAPANDNAVDSLLAGWQADAAHLQLPDATGTLMESLADETTRRIAGDDQPGALALVRKADALADAAGPHGGPPLQAFRDAMEKAFAARIALDAKALDRDAAAAKVRFASGTGLTKAALARLQAQLDRIPTPGARFVDEIGDMILLRDGERLFASMRRAVSRDEYARFATATNRPPARCRERASLLRMLDPRDWTQPGYPQQGDDPVACVSWRDASAYAQWLS